MALFTIKFLSDVLAMPGDLTVVLPDFAWGHAETPRFPVLYLLHGFAGDSMDFLRFTSIERFAWQKGIAVVMPSGYNSAYTDMCYGEDYFTYISQEVPRFVTSTLPISSKPEETYVCGCSMGGYGAMKWAMTCPESFSAVVSLSGSLHAEDRLKGHSRNAGRQLNGIYGDPPTILTDTQDVFEMLKSNVDAGIKLPRMLLTCAEDDKPYLRAATQEFYDLAVSLGLSPKRIGGFGGHGYNYWDPQLPEVLDFCLKNK